MKRTSPLSQTAILALGIPAVLLASGGTNYEISRSLITAVGEGPLTGDGYELNGLVESVHPTHSEGDGYEVATGFWYPLPPTDCDEDGYVSLLDYQVFELCLTGPGLPPDPGCECFDVDRNGAIELADFAAAQTYFSGS